MKSSFAQILSHVLVALLPYFVINTENMTNTLSVDFPRKNKQVGTIMVFLSYSILC